MKHRGKKSLTLSDGNYKPTLNILVALLYKG